MKFPIPTVAKAKTLHIERLNGGLDFSESQISKVDNGLSEVKNMWFKDGVLKNRPGINTSEENLLNNYNYQGGFSYYYKLTDIEITLEEQTKRMFLEEIDIDDDHHVLLTHFINTDSSFSHTAQIQFNRNSDSVYYIPQTISFFKGAPKNGGGIFAIARLVNVENFSQFWNVIYEISNDLTMWDVVTDTYIPTVLINGRGNNYEISAATNQAFTGTPTRLEKLNLLNGAFYAYFSTDGRSSSFRLPFSDLADGEVSCRFYNKIDSFIEWIIPQGSNSATKKYTDVDVTMHINRKTGIVNFTVAAGDFEVPLITHQNENNLRFCAVKNLNYGIDDVAASTTSVSHNSKIFLAGKNCIFQADYRQPLYFPYESMCYVGDGDTAITAFTPINSKIVVFKDNETYLLSIKNGEAINSVSLLADNDSVFYHNDTMQCQCVSYTIGCNADSLPLKRGKNILWRGNDGYIYSLGSDGQVLCISRKINEFINGNLNATATCSFELENYCVFITQNHALAAEINALSITDADDVKWYYWEFPSQLQFAGAFCDSGSTKLLCCNTEFEISFTATLTGDSDVILTGPITDLLVESRPINSFIRTKRLWLSCENSLKKVGSVTVMLNAKKATLKINDRIESKFCRHKGENALTPVTMKPAFCGINHIDITAKGESPISIGGIHISFTELGL